MPGFGSVGVWEVFLILAILLLVFGAKRLPEIGSALGRGIREFKGSIREIEGEIKRPDQTASRDLPRSERSERAEPREAPREAPPRAEAPRTGPTEPETRPAETRTPVEADRRTE